MKITLLIMSTLFSIDFLLVSTTLTEETFSVEALFGLLSCAIILLAPFLVVGFVQTSPNEIYSIGNKALRK